MAKAAATSIFYTAHSVRRQPEMAPTKEKRPFYFAAITTLLSFAIAGALFYIGIRVKVVNLGYRINQEILNKESLIEDSKKLDLEIARLKSPTRIESEARHSLGLSLPTPSQIIYVDRVTPAELSRTLAQITPGKAKPIEDEAVEKAPVAEKKVAQTNSIPKAEKKLALEQAKKKELALAPTKAPTKTPAVEKPEKKLALASVPLAIHNDKVIPEKKPAKAPVAEKTSAAEKPVLAEKSPASDKSKLLPHNSAVKNPSARLSDLTPIAKVASNKNSGYKAKPSVPAIMLDSMP